MTAMRDVVWRGAMAGLCWVLLAAQPHAARATLCGGDCNGDDTVTVSELILMVNVALERVNVDRCAAGDTSGDGAISIDEIVAGVDHALDGCGLVGPPPTPTVASCTLESCRACGAADTLCQPGQTGAYCCTLNGGFFGNPPSTPPAGVNDPLDGCRFSGTYVNPTPAQGANGCWSAAGSGTCYTQYVCLSGATPAATATNTLGTAATPTATATNGGGATPTSTTSGGTPTATPNGGTPTPTATAASGAGLWQAIGIGADWGPHWSASTTDIDPRDNQDDSAFPPEICLIANAGFQSVRLYGENVATWMAVVEGVQAYNNGSLVCVPGQQGPPSQPLSVVYEASICGPDPASMPWNGAVTAANVGNIMCRPTPGQLQTSFQASVQAEILKLKQVLRYAGPAFADTVKLVLVGNEILFSSGTCNTGGAACSSSTDCGGNGPCNIAHYCSGTLSGPQDQAIACVGQSDCGPLDFNPNGLCTDVTNGQALAWAFDQVQAVLAAELGAANVPPISISLQIDVMTGTTPGLPAATAPVLWSRQQLAKSLPAQVIAVNAYPDQWGLVPAGGSVPPYPSCIEAGNAVNGSVLGQDVCPGDAALYTNPVTNTLAHSIDTDVQLLTQYYPGFQVMFAETGWHTDGTCSEYNDSSASATRYSPSAAGTYLQALYQYVTTKQIPLLVFELFDQKTKSCAVPTGTPPAEANYGVLTNYCQSKGGTPTPLPSTANTSAFNQLLSPDGNGGVSCEKQSLLVVQGVGNTGVCAGATGTSCLTGCGTNGNCVWGYCAENTSQGCNPDDPNNPSPCTCTRAGNCYSESTPAGFYAPPTPPIPSCTSASDCSTVTCPFGSSCRCYVAMAPSTLPAGSFAEGPGATVQYGNGSFTFAKSVGPLALVQPQAGGTFIAQPLWDNLVVGKDWTVSLQPPSGASSGGSPSPCTNTVKSVTPGSGASITWQSAWSCSYQPSQSIGVLPTTLSLPRTYLSSIPTWPPP